MTKPQKYKLLLDESCEVRKFFPLLNNFHSIKHVAKDYKKSGISDEDVLKLAEKTKCLVITYNIKDFAKLLSSSNSGVIGISHQIPPHEIDKKLMSLLRRKKPYELYGRVTIITGETES